MIDLDAIIPAKFSQLLSVYQVYEYRCIPYYYEDNHLLIYTQGTTKEQLKELSILSGYTLKPTEIDEQEFLKLTSRTYRNQKNTTNLNYSSDFLTHVIQEAISLASSDIHFEIFEHQARVRYRLDGKLIERFEISLSDYPQIVNRIKIMAQLDIAEKRLPQDGRIGFKSQATQIDIRTSILPTLYGEKMVLRLLSKDQGLMDITQLGMSENQLDLYLKNINRPNGLVLISGPTGSGKTTTLYASLNELNSEDTNIMTIEDPIEYAMEGINQVQVKSQIGLNFASSLKSFLRQDPDIIMVGEIRDQETAEMAIRAALTGHLVFSTIHTNSALSTINRLIDMGVPQFLLESTLNLSIAQRLIRKLCVECRIQSDDLQSFEPEIKKHISKHYLPLGCPNCHYTGYKGRQAIYELVENNQELKNHIQSPEYSDSEFLKTQQISSLSEQITCLIINGTTSYEEAYPILNHS